MLNRSGASGCTSGRVDTEGVAVHVTAGFAGADAGGAMGVEAGVSVCC